MNNHDTNFLDDTKENNFSQKTSKIAQEVLSSLNQQDIPIFPENFEALFDHLAHDDDCTTFKKILSERVDISSETNERLLHFELDVQEGLQHARKILEITHNIYKDVVIAHTISKKKTDEILKINNPIAFKSAIQVFFQDFEKLQNNMEVQIKEIQTTFKKISSDINRVHQNTIHDLHYGIYNKRYFLDLCKREIETLKQIQQRAVFATFSLTRKFIEDLHNKDEMKKSLKIMAKTLNENIGSDDLLCYFGSGRFMILYKYIELERVVEKTLYLCKIARNTPLFFGSKETTLNICAGISMIEYHQDIQENLERSLLACTQAFNQEKDYCIAKENI